MERPRHLPRVPPPVAALAVAVILAAAAGTAPAGTRDAAPPRASAVTLREGREATVLGVRLSERARVTGLVEGRRPGGGWRVTRRFGPVDLAAGPRRIRLRPLPGGEHRVRLWLRDPAGNTGGTRVRAHLPVRLVIAASGDLLIHGSVYRRALALGGGRRYDLAPLLAPLRPVIAAADLAVCHAETPIGGGPPLGYPVFRAPAALAPAIRTTGFDACTTASNHTLDGGLAGIAATHRALGGAGVAHAGSYTSAGARRRPLVVTVRGVRVAIVAATEHTNGIPLPAPWAVPLARIETIRADVRRARRAGARVVIVNVHWGDEYRHTPSAFQRRLARLIARTPGVTAIVGQHAHVVQPITRIGGVPVVYGEGNQISGQTGVRQDGLVALLGIVVDGRRARVTRVGYVATWVRHPDLAVLPVRRSLARGIGPAAALRASAARTAAVAGHGRRIREVAGVGEMRRLIARDGR